MNNNFILELKNIKKIYSTFQLRDISFSIREGEIYGLIGANGAGKSTTLKLILKMIQIDGGNILFYGEDIGKDKKNLYKERIGYIGESTDFFPNVKLQDIAQSYKQFYSTWDQNYFDELIEQFELNLHNKMKELSKGMKMKFSIALCFSHHPKLLLMDEPTSGLDPLIRIEVLKMMREYVDNNQASILFSSHITEDLEKISDYLVFLDHGRMAYQIDTESLKLNDKDITAFIEEKLMNYKEEAHVSFD